MHWADSVGGGWLWLAALAALGASIAEAAGPLDPRGRIHIPKCSRPIGLHHHVIVGKVIVTHSDRDRIAAVRNIGPKRPSRRTVHHKVALQIIRQRTSISGLKTS